MANLEMLTINAVGDGWIDNVPGGVATGYQAQNTNLTARSLGADLTSVEVTTTEVILHGNSGAIDVNGVPFTMVDPYIVSRSSLSDSSFYYFKVVDDTTTTKNLSLTTIAPTWNPVKQYYETSTGERVLNWCFYRAEDTLSIAVERLEKPQTRLGNSHLGIGIGGKRYFTQPGTYEVRVNNDGIYSLGIVGPGRDNGKGGDAARVELTLKKGQFINVVVGTQAQGMTMVTITSRLNMQAQKSSSQASISVTGAVALASETYTGGTFATISYDPGGDDDIVTEYVADGGGAGPFGNGNDGFGWVANPGIGTAAYGGMDGACQVGTFGKGKTGTGYCEIEFLGI